MVETVLRGMRLPGDGPVRDDKTRVESLLRKRSMRVGAAPIFWPGLWSVFDDTDGSVLLIPLCDADPGFAIIPSAAGYEVLICDPEDMDEMGPFDTIDDLLDGIARWFALPCRSIEVETEFTERYPPTSILL